MGSSWSTLLKLQARTWVTPWCVSCRTCPLGGGRWEHYLCNLWGECTLGQPPYPLPVSILGSQNELVDVAQLMIALP